MASTLPVTRQLARAALLHIHQHGFTAAALLQAAPSLSPTLPLPQPLTAHTLNALYPSPPARETTPGEFSLKGLLLGNGGKKSLSKQELVALARGQGTARRGRERTGPARALVREWLLKGREDMVRTVNEAHLGGKNQVEAYRIGIETRLRYNQDVLDKLPEIRPSSRSEALALLNAPTSTYLTDLSAAVPIPHVSGHLAHVAEIAHDLARASGSQAQGTEWYSLRLRLGTVYALSELSLLAPSSSSSSTSTSATLTPSERIDQAVLYSRELLQRTGRVGQELENAGMFAEWVRKSWMGIGRSLAA
ncbi:hypothetical protein JCM10908_000096 [Rhodotorula pacifica]|uniref:uncharacterized protein n=1 Tax=Rhodotorula pacifica TaxID=1495444 RepID=UPI0031794FC5